MVFDRLAEQTGATGDQRGGLRSLVDRIIAQVKIDYLGFKVPDKFVVGYGLDAAQKFRNLDFIGSIES